MKTQADYGSFLSGLSKSQWARLGLKRRAGVAVPLFSLYSRQSIGIGELPDLKLLIDWCEACGMSLIQLLPMNDVGFDFTPYDAKSMFALEPMFLALEKLKGSDVKPFLKEIEDLRMQFPCGKGRVNYGVKKAKLELLRKICESSKKKKSRAFETYCEDNRFWLRDYALFKVIKELEGQKGWESWAEPFREKRAEAMAELEKTHGERLRFFSWLQWQLYEQFREVKQYGESRGVFFMGDLPFLVSRDSADVWAWPDYFKRDREAGAPPDSYFALGQRWGMPAYRWEAIAAKGYDYVIEKLRYAENFYDLFRIDHVVGVFRLWTIAGSEPAENAGLNGQFDPPDKAVWEEHGRRLLGVMIENTKMLPCGEDLGTVPPCSYEVLKDFGVPGMDVQRWQRDWEGTLDFKAPGQYRKNSISVLSTHDMTPFGAWWDYELGTVDALLFQRACETKGIDFSTVKAELFNEKASGYGRLRWRADLRDREALIRIVGRPENEIYDLLAFYRETFDEKSRYLKYMGMAEKEGRKFSVTLLRRALERAGEAASVFSIQALQDWLGLEGFFSRDPWKARINVPGTVGDQNWSLVMPLSLEEMNQLKSNSVIREIHQKTERE